MRFVGGLRSIVTADSTSTLSLLLNPLLKDSVRENICETIASARRVPDCDPLIRRPVGTRSVHQRAPQTPKLSKIPCTNLPADRPRQSFSKLSFAVQSR